VRLFRSSSSFPVQVAGEGAALAGIVRRFVPDDLFPPKQAPVVFRQYFDHLRLFFRQLHVECAGILRMKGDRYGGIAYAADDKSIRPRAAGDLKMTGTVGNTTLLGVFPGNAG